MENSSKVHYAMTQSKTILLVHHEASMSERIASMIDEGKYSGTFQEAEVAPYRQGGESDIYSQSFTLIIRYCTIANLVPLISMADQQDDA